jgi:hypothetical protein
VSRDVARLKSSCCFSRDDGHDELLAAMGVLRLKGNSNIWTHKDDMAIDLMDHLFGSSVHISLHEEPQHVVLCRTRGLHLLSTLRVGLCCVVVRRATNINPSQRNRHGTTRTQLDDYRPRSLWRATSRSICAEIRLRVEGFKETVSLLTRLNSSSCGLDFAEGV